MIIHSLLLHKSYACRFTEFIKFSSRVVTWFRKSSQHLLVHNQFQAGFFPVIIFIDSHFLSPCATFCDDVRKEESHEIISSMSSISIANASVEFRRFENQSLQREFHDDVIKWKHFPRYWPFSRGIHRSPVSSPHKRQWRGALMFLWSASWANGWENSRKAGDLRRHRAHYDVIVMVPADDPRQKQSKFLILPAPLHCDRYKIAALLQPIFCNWFSSMKIVAFSIEISLEWN